MIIPANTIVPIPGADGLRDQDVIFRNIGHGRLDDADEQSSGNVTGCRWFQRVACPCEPFALGDLNNLQKRGIAESILERYSLSL